MESVEGQVLPIPPPSTQSKEMGPMNIVFREDNLKVTLQKDKHGCVIGILELSKLVVVYISKPIVPKDLKERSPSMGHHVGSRPCIIGEPG